MGKGKSDAVYIMSLNQDLLIRFFQKFTRALYFLQTMNLKSLEADKAVKCGRNSTERNGVAPANWSSRGAQVEGRRQLV